MAKSGTDDGLSDSLLVLQMKSDKVPLGGFVCHRFDLINGVKSQTRTCYYRLEGNNEVVIIGLLSAN